MAPKFSLRCCRRMKQLRQVLTSDLGMSELCGVKMEKSIRHPASGIRRYQRFRLFA
jgi:hypothetical protein